MARWSKVRCCLLPSLSSDGARVIKPSLRFHIPLIEPDMQISRIRLSDKTSRFHPRLTTTKLCQTYETIVPVEMRQRISPTSASSDFVLVDLPLITPRGFPCCVRFPCVHAVTTTPAQRLGSLMLNHPAVSAFPEMAIGSACATSFSRLAQCSLTLRPAHSRCHHISRHASPEASTTSLPPQLLRLLPAGADCRVGLSPTGKAPP